MSAHVLKLAPAVLLAAGATSLGGCATRSYVREQIAPVSQRVDAIDARLQDTDRTAKQALAESQAASGQIQASSQRIDQLNGRVDTLEQNWAAQRQTPRRARH